MIVRFRMSDNFRTAARSYIPGLRVQYSRNGGLSWTDLQQDTQIAGNVTIATR